VNAVAARREKAPALPRPWYERTWQALPLVAVFACFSVVYAWQAWLQQTPTVFFDELYYARLAGSVAGTDERLGGGFSFETLYAFLIAPAWLLRDTESAYETAKFIGVVVMTAAAFPAYWLARMLVSRPLALFVGAATVATPALSYSSLVMQETLAYPYATACLLLMTKALATGSRRWLAAAAAGALVAPFVRDELVVVPGAFAVAALAVGWGSDRIRVRRARWSARHRLALAAALLGVLLAAHVLLTRISHEWAVAVEHRDRMLESGASAAGALAIGLGVLPVVAGLAALVRPDGEPRSRVNRAFVGVFVASTLGFLLYTAGKGAYLSPGFGNLIEERNLVYVSPLLFTGTALWLARLRIHPIALVGAAALVASLVFALPYRFPGYPIADAPSFSLVETVHRELGWGERGLDAAALAVVGGAVGIVVLVSALRRRPRFVAAALVGVPCLILAWNVTAQAIASDESRDFSEGLLATQPAPIEWIDRRTDAGSTLYVGQQLTDPTQVMLLAFWNRHVTRLWSVDATQGPIEQTGVATPDGRLVADRKIEYVVTDGHVDVVGSVVAKKGLWRLYEIRSPLRLRAVETGVHGDRWSTGDSAYSQFSTPGGRAGFVTVRLSRANWCPRKHAPADVRITVGRLALTGEGRLRMGRVKTVRHWPAQPCASEQFVLHTPPAPFRVEVRVEPTFVPAELNPAIQDFRRLGVQLDYRFTTQPPPLFRGGS
jgi:hypothetical protein